MKPLTVTLTIKPTRPILFLNIPVTIPAPPPKFSPERDAFDAGHGGQE